MNIGEMHVWFRQYAQQMGMQNVRAILPEQIDLVINTSITDTVNQIVKDNIGITNDRVITDNSKINQINALATLYKVKEIDATSQESPSNGKPFKKQSETFIYRQSGDINKFDSSGNFDYMFLVDLSLNYSRTTPTEIITNYFPVRLIDDAYLADTLNDFVLRPRLRTPVAVIYNNTLDLYLDVLQGNSLPEGLTPNLLRLSYIAKPAIVHYGADLGGTNVDCDLPEYMHIDVLKHAVDLWRIAVNGSLHSQQQQEEAQGRENMRNQYRNETGNPQRQ